MSGNWEDLERDLATLRTSVAALRGKSGELRQAEIEPLLAAVRACIVELIALRSSLEKDRPGKAKGGAPPP